MENYAANSHKAKAEKKEVEQRAQKVISGTAKTKKKSGFKKFTEAFVNEDLAKVRDFILNDVIIPNVKKIVSETINNTVDMMLYGNVRSDRSRNNGGLPYVSYDRFSQDDSRGRQTSQPVRRGYAYEDVVVPTRADAETVLRQLDGMMATYHMVRVADLYDLVGITHNYTDNDYGWTNIRNAQIIHVSDGYQIKMPRAIPIDR